MLDIRDIKKNDIFYDCQYGVNVKYLALESAHRKDDEFRVWQIRACQVTNERVVTLSWREPNLAYHPKLYREPQYVNARTFQAKID